MPRYKLVIEYDGTEFAGWQRQANGPSIQAALEAAVFGFCGDRADVIGAGRTDAGVHALGQCAHVDLAKEWPESTVRTALNDHLRPLPVVVLDAARVAEDFHARFSANLRRYRYRIINRPSPPAIDRHRAWHVVRPLDWRAMAEATRVLIGYHDFSSFRGADCQARSPLKTLGVLDVTRAGDEIRVAAAARSFLHHQVRIMVGTLALVGQGKWDPADVAAALAARDRSAAGPTAPAMGLILVGVGYRGGP